MGTIVGSVINPMTLTPAGWWDFSDASTVTLSGSNITQITDKSGNGKTLSQGTAGRRPTYATASQNGLNTASFDGGDCLAAATAADWTFLHNGTSYIIAMAVRVGTVADPNTNYMLLATDNVNSAAHGMKLIWDDRVSVPRNEVIFHEVDRNSVGTFSVLNISGNGALPPNAYRVLTALADPDNATAATRSSMIVNNGTAIANNTQTSSVTATAPLGPLTIGAGVDQTSIPLVGNFCELVIVSGANATAANALRLSSYLRNKWGI